MTILTFEPLTYPPVEGDEDPEGTFSRVCWLPVAGPTAWLLWTTVARQLRSDKADGPTGKMVAWDWDALATAHGVSRSGGSTAPLRRALERLERFRLFACLPSERVGERWAVRLSAPPLSEGQLDRSAPHVATLQRATFGAWVAS